MSEPLSALQNFKMPINNGIENNYNLANLTNLKLDNFKLDNFLTQNDIQNPGNYTKIDNGVNKIDFSKVSQDSELKADLQGLIQKTQPYDDNIQPEKSEITTGEVADKFSDILGNYVNNVNQQNRTAEKAVETFASGGNIDMHSVMIASEKANLSMELALQMRNKILQAYQEVSRMQV